MSDLRARLSAAIEQAKLDAEGVEFAAGDGYCAIWVADIYREVFQCDPAKFYRGRFSNMAEANELLGKRGLAGAVMQTAKMMGWHRIKPKAAKVGDLALLKTGDGREAVGIFDGGLFVGLINCGYSGHPVESARRAWSVA